MGNKRSVAVIGAGSWGTTLAHHLAGNGNSVNLWVYEEELFREIEEKRENSVYLPGIRLDDNVLPCNDLESALAGAEVAVYVTPSHVARAIFHRSAPSLPPDIPVVVASKGIETDTLKTMSQVFAEEVPGENTDRFAYLSGPSFAREVARKLPTAVSVASGNAKTAAFIQTVFSTDSFRVYTNPDVIGVEVGGALKNVMAIAAGISDGLALGHNARSALITRGLAEITRLGVSLGAMERTFAGLSGIGDLVLTCCGDLSRNRTLGKMLGEGRSLKDILAEMRMVAEGVKTTLAAVRLARKMSVELPIAEQIHSVLYEEKSPQLALHELMGRVLRGE